MENSPQNKIYRILEIINQESPRKRRTELRNLLCEKLGYALKTLYMKMRATHEEAYRFYPKEEIIIAETLGVTLEEIFAQQTEPVQ